MNSTSTSTSTPNSKKFLNAFNISLDGDKLPISLIELQLMQAMGVIKNKSEWTRKILDQTIERKWRKELLVIFSSSALLKSCKEKWVKYVMDELKWISNLIEMKNGGKEKAKAKWIPGGVEGIQQLDQGIQTKLHSNLLSLVKRLETDSPIDWHPESENQVRDLVHPSLYCNVIGKTLCLPFFQFNKDPKKSVLQSFCRINAEKEKEKKKEEIEEINKRKENNLKKDHDPTSTAWIPSEITLDLKGSAFFKTYINNLNPVKYEKLYSCLEQMFTIFIPRIS